MLKWTFRALFCAFLLAGSSHIEAALFFSDTTIGNGDTTYDGEDIVVVGCTVTIQGPHTFSDLAIIEEGRITIPSNSFTGLSLTITTNAYIEAGSSIDVQGMGPASGEGGGAGASAETTIDGVSYESGGGGGYGGNGGSSLGGATGGTANGTVVAAAFVGSGGGAGLGAGGAGGGSISLVVGGTLEMDGECNANGGDGANLASGAGSGGGIMLSATLISGSGLISANGGTSDGFDGGGGGGGRIALFFTTNDFTGGLSASGGEGAEMGGAGTIDLQSSNALAQIIIDNGGGFGANTPLNVPSRSSVTIRGGAMAFFSLEPVTLSSLEIDSNSWLVPGPSPYLLDLTVNTNLTIEAGGGINLDGGGGLSGPGTGSAFHTNNLTYGGGGGYGGNGGNGFNAAGGHSSGSYNEPTTSGGGGGAGSGLDVSNPGGAGGGALNLTVSGAVTLNGAISADGTAGLGEGSGGGAGGSLYLTMGTLAGSGQITATGGAAGSNEGGGGGGGRIALYTIGSQFAGFIAAHGGSGFVAGGAGTVYIATDGSFTPPFLLLDNGGLSGATTPIPQFSTTTDLTITDAAVGTVSSQVSCRDLVVGPNSSLLAASGSSTPVSMSVSSNATIQAGGRISVDGLVSNSFSSIPGTGGGGNAGTGGNGATGLGGAASGSIELNDAIAGVAGNGGLNRGGGAGGGALTMLVSGNLLINGLVSANGAPGIAGTGGGGGSGGGIYLSAGAFSGSGTVSAKGGAGDSLIGGGGGGGRITVSCASNSFAGALTPYGGSGFVAGGAGITYVVTNGSSYGEVTLDNGSLTGTNTPLLELPSCDLSVTNGAVAALSEGSSGSFRNLVIGSNSFINIVPYQSEAFTMRLTGNGTIMAGGGIILDGEGYPGGEGSAAGHSSESNSLTTGGGGGNGGDGGNSAFGATGGGSYYAPYVSEGPGSGGGAGFGGTGGAGGGSLSLAVTGALTLNGILSADGAPGLNEGSGGGSGGDISISAATFSGNGAISANGGSGQDGIGGGGGGGIIETAITSSNLFTGTFSAHGGTGATAGGAGDILEESTQNGSVTQLIINNAGLFGTNSPLPSISGLYDLTVTGGAILSVAGNSELEVSARNLVVGSNSFITSVAGEAVTSIQLNLSSNATIMATGGVIANGIITSSGQGAGGTVNTNGGGGGYGGVGGMGAGGASGGAAFGSVSEPDSPGGVGGGGVNASGAAGGGVQMNVTGTLSVGGVISANGGRAKLPSGGGGAGGSVFLTAGSVTGSGSISANGGSGQLGGGGGGGGRIAVISPSLQFTGPIFAHGGAGFANGGAGTIYTAFNSEGSHAQIVVDNGGLSNGVTSLSTQQSVSNLIVQGGAVLTALPSGTVNFLIASNGMLLLSNSQMASISVTGNFTVQAGGSLILQPASLGGQGEGQSATVNGYTASSGGGHGGYGGASATGALGGIPFDLMNSPNSLGGVAPGANGGGALNLSVRGTLQVDGLIAGNGASAASEGGGGGAGGGLNLTAGVMAGAGVISANGGAGDFPSGGGGGGGRIAVHFVTNLFTGAYLAHGGAGFVGGGAGTVYLATQFQSATNASSQLIIDNGGLTGAVTPIPSTPVYGLTTTGGALVEPPSFGVNIILDNLNVASNAVIRPAGPLMGLSLTVLGNALVATNGSISVDGEGYYQSNMGPGAGAVATNGDGSGGGYGGMGGPSAGGAPGGMTNGSPQQPTSAGSAGGAIYYYMDSTLSPGGGVISLDVGGTLTVNGTISANGEAGLFPGSGGGAGGSIWLVAGALGGQGVIRANGGEGQGNVGGGGGGGRIALYALTNNFAGVTTVSGGTGFASGQPGSLYVSTNVDGPSVVAQIPSAVMAPPFSSVEFYFDSLLSSISIASPTVTITTPSGPLSSGGILSSVSGETVSVSFPAQTNLGTYTVEISGVENIYGVPMSAPYTGTFTISYPSISLAASQATNSSSLNLQWTGLGGVTYQVEFSTDLVHWQPYGAPIVSGNGVNTITLPIGTDPGTFYQLVLANP
jgi:hypothetical protein